MKLKKHEKLKKKYLKKKLKEKNYSNQMESNVKQNENYINHLILISFNMFYKLPLFIL